MKLQLDLWLAEGSAILTLDACGWGLSIKKYSFFWSAKYWLNLIFCLTYTTQYLNNNYEYIFWPIFGNGPQVAFSNDFLNIFFSWERHENCSVWDAL